MKLNSFVGVLLAFCSCLLVNNSYATTTDPMFAGTSLVISTGGSDYTYTWVRVTSENFLTHTDIYANSIYQITVQGYKAHPSVATVTGSKPGGDTISGVLQDGVYRDKVQTVTSTVDLTLNGKNYNSLTATTTNTVLPSGVISSPVTQRVYTGDATLNVAADGRVSGAETGYYLNETWYLDNTVTSDTSLTLPSGRVYTSYVYKTTYILSNGQAVPSVVETYSNSMGYHFTVATDGTISGSEMGYVSGGQWYVNHSVTLPIDYTSPEGRHYVNDVVVTDYSRDANGVVTGSETEYVGGNGMSFQIAPNGAITGSETGLAINGTWYLNYSHDAATADYTSPQGVHYTSSNQITTYTADGSGGALASTSTFYTDNGGEHKFAIDATGKITGAETGYKINGNWYVNETGSATSNSGVSSFNVFGVTYTFGSGYASYNVDSQNNLSSIHWYDIYTNNAGNYAQIDYSWELGDAQPTQTLSGVEMYVGSFSADYSSGINNLVWQPRVAPSFAASTLYLNEMLMNWQSGVLDNAGVVTDTYNGTDGQTLVIKASLRDFSQGTGNAAVSLNGNNIGSFAYDSHGAYNLAGWNLETRAANRFSPFFASNSVSPYTFWVDGTAYHFFRGYDDEYNNRTDVYLASGGTVTIAGNTAFLNNVYVQVNHNGELHIGSANFDPTTTFNVEGIDISLYQPQGGPQAFWVGGVFYVCTAVGNQYVSFPTPGSTLNLGSTTSEGTWVACTQPGGSITGRFHPGTGIFTLTRQGGALVPGCSALASGAQVPGATAPNDYPPALRVGTEVWCYLGTAADDGAPTTTAAYYGNTRTDVYSSDPTAPPLTADDHRRLLKIRLDGSGVVTLTDYQACTSSTGIYSTQTHLIQADGTSQYLMTMPIYGVDPNTNDTPWQLSTPPPMGNSAPGSAPSTLLVGGEVWRYTGQDANGRALYQGYYQGQQLTLGAPNVAGRRTITVIDPFNGDGSGMLSDVSGSTTLSNGQSINSGTVTGVQVQPQNVATVGGDLAVPGNILSIGTLSGGSTTQGATLQFSDNGTQAMFGTALGRSAAQWVWWRVDPANSHGFVPTMVVDSAYGLVLYDPANSSLASVKLNPAADGVSELPRLKLTHQTLDADGTSALTSGLGDERYLRASGANQSLSLGGGINVNIGGGGSTNTVPADAAAIGQNLQAASGQVVVGRNSVADSDEIFIVGAGTSSTETKNALSVSTSGNTSVMGTLTVAGTATLSSAAISGTLTVGGQSVLTQNAADTRYIQASQVDGNNAILTQDAADTRYMQKGQILRVAPAGDIDMGEFQTTPPGVTAPAAP